MKVSEILLCIFLSAGTQAAYSSEPDVEMFDFDKQHFSGQADSFADLFNSMNSDRTGLDLSNPQFEDLEGLGDDEIPVDHAEVARIASWLQGKDSVAGKESDIYDTSALSSPDSVASPSVTQAQIDAAIRAIVDNQSIVYDRFKGYGVANCVYCRKGFGDYGREKTAVSKIKQALTKHYNNDHRNNIIFDKIYKK